MKTTLNLPDQLVERAKRFALSQRTTLTQLLTDGLKKRLLSEQSNDLPVSTSGGGLVAGCNWLDLQAPDQNGQWHR